MKFAILSTLLGAAAIVTAIPIRRTVKARASNYVANANLTETETLNFALMLEHAENAFYIQGLQNYTQQDFLDAGLPEFARGRWVEIGEHETTHVDFLTSLLGEQAVLPCEYSFPATDPPSFAAVSFMLETVGTSAYSGAAQFLTDKSALTAAAAILSVEARQSAWIHSSVLQANPWSSAFDTPLDFNQLFTIASAVTVSCPDTNMQLPVQAFPALTFPSTAQPGQTVSITFDDTEYHNSHHEEELYVAFLQGLGVTYAPLDIRKMTVTIPAEIQGVVFALVVRDRYEIDDNVTVAGPAFLTFDFNSSGEDELSG